MAGSRIHRSIAPSTRRGGDARSRRHRVLGGDGAAALRRSAEQPADVSARRASIPSGSKPTRTIASPPTRTWRRAATCCARAPAPRTACGASGRRRSRSGSCRRGGGREARSPAGRRWRSRPSGLAWTRRPPPRQGAAGAARTRDAAPREPDRSADRPAQPAVPDHLPASRSAEAAARIPGPRPGRRRVGRESPAAADRRRPLQVDQRSPLARRRRSRALPDRGGVEGTRSADSDLAVRWGGDEFLVVTRSFQRRACAASPPSACAPRWRRSGAAHGQPRAVRPARSRSASRAFPFLPREPEALTWEQTLELADHALRLTKRRRRNSYTGLRASAGLGSAPVLAFLAAAGSTPLPDGIEILIP